MYYTKLLILVLLSCGYLQCVDTYSDYAQLANESLIKRQDEWKAKYNIGSYESYWYDQDKQILQFKNGDEVKLEFKVAAIGTYAEKSSTWMWSWANPSIDKAMSEPVLKVKEFGQTNSYPLLTKDVVPGSIEDAWEFSAISMMVLGGMAVYSAPNGKSRLFLLVLSDNRAPR
jgi:hypothetical protein